jgi:S-methylmethionine-dependent homocysteine/selenocysteine methylase
VNIADQAANQAPRTRAMYDAHRIMPQLSGEIFVTDGGLETHMIFNEGQDLPNFSAFLLLDSEAGREKIREYYRAYIPIAQRAGKGFVFDTNTWRASADWGALVGYDTARLRQNNIDAVRFCREMQAEFTAARIGSLSAASSVHAATAGSTMPR